MRSADETVFWQLLLAAELPFSKLAKLLPEWEDLPNEVAAIGALKSICRTSEGATGRIERAESRLDILNKSAAYFLPTSQLPDRVASSLPGMPGVWANGDRQVLQNPCVGIVGTRGATTYGKACAMKFSETLARAGATIISGGAFGIDAAAHKGSMDCGGQTVAVMPCGVDVAYPASHRDLYSKIRMKGLIVSQFACGMTPRHDTFLTRNAMIAALCDAILIVEAPEASGALHTANRAADMGRPVYVVPGAITQNSFSGSHGLIRSGATLVSHPDQILEDLAIMKPALHPSRESATGVQKRILELLSSEPISAEKLAETVELDPSDALSELTMLELEGRVIRSFGGFVLKP